MLYKCKPVNKYIEKVKNQTLLSSNLSYRFIKLLLRFFIPNHEIILNSLILLLRFLVAILQALSMFKFFTWKVFALASHARLLMTSYEDRHIWTWANDERRKTDPSRQAAFILDYFIISDGKPCISPGSVLLLRVKVPTHDPPVVLGSIAYMPTR